MANVNAERVETEFAQALDDITAGALAALVPVIEAYGLASELDTIVRTARPSSKVQRRFMPAALQGDIFRSALRTAKAQDLVQDIVVAFYADELGDDVADPSLDQLAKTSKSVASKIDPQLVKATLLGVVFRQEVAAPHAITVLKDQFGLDLTK